MTAGGGPGVGVVPLRADRIRSALMTRTVAGELYVFDRVDSTNAVLARMARAGASEGSVVIAEEQTAGQGRSGKPWFSPPGVNLHLSVLFRPRIAARDVPIFSFIASLAVSDTIQAEGETATIKWPNDILVARKKVAGTLVEAAARVGETKFVVLGVGVNLNVTRAALHDALGDAGRAANSLAEVVGCEIDRNRFASTLLNAFEDWFEIYTRTGPATLLAAWRDREVVTGRRVEIRVGDGASFDGRVAGLDAEGHLVVKDSRGASHRVVSGDIRFLD